MNESLSQLVSDFLTEERAVGVLLSEQMVMAQAKAAVRFYAGYADLINVQDGDTLSCDTLLTPGEWAIIRPLFLLFVERESALQLEASRGLGVDPYGRSTSEIAGEIAAYEQEMAHKCFVQPILTDVQDENAPQFVDSEGVKIDLYHLTEFNYLR